MFRSVRCSSYHGSCCSYTLCMLGLNQRVTMSIRCTQCQKRRAMGADPSILHESNPSAAALCKRSNYPALILRICLSTDGDVVTMQSYPFGASENPLLAPLVRHEQLKACSPLTGEQPRPDSGRLASLVYFQAVQMHRRQAKKSKGKNRRSGGPSPTSSSQSESMARVWAVLTLYAS